MRKLTRRSYNRKLIMLGLALFLSVGLISTGFSAWLISSVNDAEATPPVTAGSISADSVEVTIDQWTKVGEESTESWKGSVIRFDAAKDDTTGRVTYKADSETGAGPEQLTMEISGTVTNYAKLAQQNGLVMTIKLPDSIAAAIAADYIALDNITDSANANTAATYDADANTITVNLATTPKTEPATDATFTYTLTFVWGSYFAGANPSVFYDSTTLEVNRGNAGAAIKGHDISDAQVTTEMNEFHRILTGREAGSQDLNKSYSGTIEIVVTPTLG